MPVVVTTSNHYKYQLGKGLIDLSADTIIVVLMNTTFAFNKDTHATLADITADQLATGNGYTQDNKALANQVFTEDDSGDQAVMTCDDVTWTASGGDIGPSGGWCMVDMTTADNTVIGNVDFGTDVTILDGFGFQINDITVPIT